MEPPGSAPPASSGLACLPSGLASSCSETPCSAPLLGPSAWSETSSRVPFLPCPRTGLAQPDFLGPPLLPNVCREPGLQAARPGACVRGRLQRQTQPPVIRFYAVVRSSDESGPSIYSNRASYFRAVNHFHAGPSPTSCPGTSSVVSTLPQQAFWTFRTPAD